MIDWLIDWLSVAFLPIQEYFNHIRSHHFRWTVGVNSISIIYCLGRCFFLWTIKQGSQKDIKHQPPLFYVSIITWSSHSEKFYQRPYHNRVMCHVEESQFICGQSQVLTGLNLGLCVCKFIKFPFDCRQEMNLINIFTIIILIN